MRKQVSLRFVAGLVGGLTVGVRVFATTRGRYDVVYRNVLIQGLTTNAALSMVTPDQFVQKDFLDIGTTDLRLALAHSQIQDLVRPRNK